MIMAFLVLSLLEKLNLIVKTVNSCFVFFFWITIIALDFEPFPIRFYVILRHILVGERVLF